MKVKTKMKHNKKRNTAFLFEVLVGELTKSIVYKNESKKEKTLRLLSKHFQKESSLYKELQLYRALLETRGLDRYVAEKLIFEVRASRRCIMDSDVFEEQSELIGDMNKEYTKSVFMNFVPNYKNIASISQLFNMGISVKDRVLLESKVAEALTKSEEKKENKMVPVDNLVYKTFVEKFNSKYSETLTESQKSLLSKYISSFADNGLELKMFLNEEIGRLKNKITEAKEAQKMFDADDSMLKNADMVLEKLESYGKEEINESMIKSVLKIQHLVQELDS